MNSFELFLCRAKECGSRRDAIKQSKQRCALNVSVGVMSVWLSFSLSALSPRRQNHLYWDVFSVQVESFLTYDTENLTQPSETKQSYKASDAMLRS